MTDVESNLVLSGSPCVMDELAASMASAAQVTASGGASTAAPHPHYSDLYKHRATTLIHQQRRRDHLLQSQKQKRFDYVGHARHLTEADWKSGGSDDDDGNSEEGTMDVDSTKFAKPGRHYKDQLMLSEWMLDIPPDFPKAWLAVLCPVGRRNLVVASRGVTSVYTKSGYCLNRFASLLPGGSRRFSHRKATESTILDCVFVEKTRTFYVLDMMCWRGQPIYDSETEFRFYWVETKLAELNCIGEITEHHPFRFEVLPNVACTKAALEDVLSKDTDVELDGVLFYHRLSHYTFGTTPLVLWLKPHMLSEVLALTVPSRHLQAAPQSYTGFNEHARCVRTRKEQLEKQDSRAADSGECGRDTLETREEVEGEAADMEDVVEGGKKTRRKRRNRKKKTKPQDMETAVDN